jgi:hypothetical protein
VGILGESLTKMAHFDGALRIWVTYANFEQNRLMPNRTQPNPTPPHPATSDSPYISSLAMVTVRISDTVKNHRYGHFFQEITSLIYFKINNFSI